jgi:hypothetical protein
MDSIKKWKKKKPGRQPKKVKKMEDDLKNKKNVRKLQKRRYKKKPPQKLLRHFQERYQADFRYATLGKPN